MKTKYNIIYIIAALLLFLTLTLSVVNYFVSLRTAQEQLKETSLPLSTDNIYSEIQTHLIEPDIVASMMAHDTFLKDWLINNEDDEANIQKFLEAIKNKYQVHTVFLASQKTQNYYSSKGFVEKMNEDKATNAWYYQFRDSTVPNEVNIDFNKYVDNKLIMFINHKIFDKSFHLLGATGVGLKLSYIDEMLRKFRQEYKFKVYFLDKAGKIVIQERDQNYSDSLKENIQLYKHKYELLHNETRTLNYEKDKQSYLVHSKFIPELNLYLLVEAKISDFTNDVKKTFYINLFVSLFITLIIIFIIMRMIKNQSKHLEDIANYDSLTQLLTRRMFNYKLKEQLLLNGRKKFEVSILFLDIDDFKKINDTFGHDVGDKVLVRVAKVIQESVRETDYVARWGGEEFIVSLVDSSLENSQVVAEKLRKNLEDDSILHGYAHYNLTASFGLTQMKEKDNEEDILKRVDDALYEAKNTGKNKVVLAS